MLTMRFEKPTHATVVCREQIAGSSSQAGETEDQSYEIAMNFIQEGIADLPKVVGHSGELQAWGHSFNDY